jgi:hypothetical protein
MQGFVSTVTNLRGYIKRDEFVELVSDCKLPKKHSSPWGYLSEQKCWQKGPNVYAMLTVRTICFDIKKSAIAHALCSVWFSQ